MKNLKKFIPVLIVVLLCMMIAPGVHAENSEGVTYTATLDTPTIDASNSENQTVVLTIKMNKVVELDGVGGIVIVPSGFTVDSMTHENEMFVYDFNSANNKFTSETEDAENISTNVLAIISYTVPANTPVGTYEVGIECNDITRDYGDTWDDGATVTATLTIADPAAHTCEGVLTKGQAATCEADGWKDYYACSCGAFYSDAECENVITDLAAWKIGDGKIASGGHSWSNPTYTDNKDGTHTASYVCGNDANHTKADAPADHVYNEDTHKCVCGAEQPSGWTKIEDAWYYIDPTTYVKATGIARVPYPTEEINGVTYAPNADDKAYWEANKDTSKYSDAESAVFWFDTDGKLNNTYTGIVPGDDVSRYAVDGMIAWHVGMVEVDGKYYYFKGDENGDGNIMATGNIYVSRNTTDMDLVNGATYTFGTDGVLCEYDGLTEIDGTVYYYEDSRLAIGAGLVKIGDDYYFVRSNGQVVIDREYWVADVNDYDLTVGLYTFDMDGKLIIPVVEEEYDGIVEIDGNLYYYIEGVKQNGAGVVEMTDDAGETYYIYVRSNGQLATGIYWPTTRNDLLERGAYDWGTDGKYYPGK